MGNPYNGNSANISYPLSLNITGISGSGLFILITTASSHHFATNDVVEIQGTTFSSGAANGTWAITVTGVTQFSIPVSGVYGSGSSGGTVQSLAMSPQITLMSDSTDPLNAAHLNPPWESLADRTQALSLATGAWKIAQINRFYWNALGSNPTVSFSSAGTTWSDFSPSFVYSGTKDLLAGDQIDVDFNGCIRTYVTLSASPPVLAYAYGLIAVWYSFDGSSYSVLPESQRLMFIDDFTSNSASNLSSKYLYLPIECHGSYSNGDGEAAATIYFKLMAQAFSFTAASGVISSVSFEIDTVHTYPSVSTTVYRTTNVPQ
jgi:hypothetical protein